ncbi:MAG: tRNA 5'-guanylyltransferase [Candidatus Eremiobacteraeota bacterium]|nr:tRNA 5'-guanylyltransferase [Candidatus Eremiobacteraeota bacterium]
MKNQDFESRMRGGEFFHSLRVPEENWTVLRLDGRGFSKFTAERFEKPFDSKFHELMLLAAEALLEEFNAVMAYTESDEISVLLPFQWDFFDREVEKVLSISASVASSVFSVALGEPAQFDSRIWIAGLEETVVDYFCWRQNDATRCALNGWAYWTLREDGLSAQEATVQLTGRNSSEKQELLFQKGINFNDLPGWQKRGSLISWGVTEKVGFNPMTSQEVVVERRALKRHEDLPHGDEYRNFLRERLR